MGGAQTEFNGGLGFGCMVFKAFLTNLSEDYGVPIAMGSRSLKKRSNKQHSLEHQASVAAMASSRRMICSYTKVSVLLSASLTIAVIGLLVISANSWRSFKSDVSYETIRVVNEFPHDPEAFTQVCVCIYIFHGHVKFMDSVLRVLAVDWKSLRNQGFFLVHIIVACLRPVFQLFFCFLGICCFFGRREYPVR